MPYLTHSGTTGRDQEIANHQRDVRSAEGERILDQSTRTWRLFAWQRTISMSANSARGYTRFSALRRGDVMAIAGEPITEHFGMDTDPCSSDAGTIAHVGGCHAMDWATLTTTDRAIARRAVHERGGIEYGEMQGSPLVRFHYARGNDRQEPRCPRRPRDQPFIEYR